VKKITVIHCWSAPRSRSTALMYSFNSRSDCCGLDEPLYRRWLQENQKYVSRPYTKELINGIPHADSRLEDHFKWEREKDDLKTRCELCVAEVEAENNDGNVIVFVKHIAKFQALFDFNNNCEFKNTPFLKYKDAVDVVHKHLLLIRDPVSILSSWEANSSVHNGAVTPNEVGIVDLMSVYSHLQSKNVAGDGSSEIVAFLDSDELSSNPESALNTVCQDLNIPFTTDMLSWEKGPKKCDGPWADWWYKGVHNSTEFKCDHARKYHTLDPNLYPAMKVSLGAYNFFQQMTSRYRNRGPRPEEIYEDPRNEHLLVYVGAPGFGRLIPRQFAGISPFDGSVQGGDATWEGIRVYNGRILSLDRHLRRLFKSAKALGFKNVHSKEEITEAIFRTLAVNGMRDEAHMRLTLTRGEKYTSSMNPNFNVYGTTLIILAEWKPTEGKTTHDNSKGISLITSSIRRNSPSTCDSKIHHNNMINNILPKIQSNVAGVDEALMLDLDGFVSETNACNIFMVDDGILMTPHADHCLPGITRETVLILAEELGIRTEVRRISLAEFHAADEVFTTGTMGALTPVTMIDGRIIGNGTKGNITAEIQDAYSQLPEQHEWSTAIPPFES